MKKATQGMTLTELLIASILVGIIMAGAVSVDFAIRRGRKNMADGAKIAMELNAAMLQMTRDAMAATGDASSPGIVSDDTGAIFNICFRYDANMTPNSYADDEWICYSQDTTQKIIRRCIQTAASGPLGGESACPAGSERITQMRSDYASPFFAVIQTGGEIDRIHFSLSTCADPSQAENPITNPCQSVTSSINPPSMSR